MELGKSIRRNAGNIVRRKREQTLVELENKPVGPGADETSRDYPVHYIHAL